MEEKKGENEKGQKSLLRCRQGCATDKSCGFGAQAERNDSLVFSFLKNFFFFSFFSFFFRCPSWTDSALCCKDCMKLTCCLALPEEAAYVFLKTKEIKEKKKKSKVI